MAEASATSAVVPLEIRAPVALRLSPAVTMLLVSLLGILGAAAFALAMDGRGLAEAAPIPSLGFATRVAVVASLTLGYTFGIWLWNVREQHREFVELNIQHASVDPQADPRSLYGVPRDMLRRSRWAGVGGVLFFIALIEMPSNVYGAPPGSAWISLHSMTYMLFLGVSFFWLIGRVAYFATNRSQLVPALERLSIDPLDRKPLRVFGRMALRNSFTWVAGASIAALALVNPEIRIGESLLVLVPLSLATLLIGAAAMLIPMRGIHARIVAAKAEELERVEAAIRGDAGALAGTRIAARKPPPSLADLIAYRDLIEKTPEWPLDAASFRRLGLYLLLPVGSWIGGALVERVVGIVLD